MKQSLRERIIKYFSRRPDMWVNGRDICEGGKCVEISKPYPKYCQKHLKDHVVLEDAREKYQCNDCLTIFTGIGDLQCPECEGKMHKIIYNEDASFRS